MNADPVAVPACGILENTPPAGIIDMNKAESLPKPVVPFNVVH